MVRALGAHGQSRRFREVGRRVRFARVLAVTFRSEAALGTVVRLRQAARAVMILALAATAQPATERRPSSDVVDPRPAQKIGRHPDDRLRKPPTMWRPAWRVIQLLTASMLPRQLVAAAGGL